MHNANEARRKAIAKVEKLLALAGSSNEHEAALAAERAHAIMAELCLTESELRNAGPFNQTFVVEAVGRTFVAEWRRVLGSALAELYFCQYYFVRDKTEKVEYDIHHMVGTKANVIVASLMFRYIVEAVERMATKGAKKLKRDKRPTYVNDFNNAAAQRLYARIMKRLADARAGEAKAEGNRNLPVLASIYDQTKKQLQEFLAGTVRPEETALALLGDFRGQVDGIKAGDAIGIDQQVGNSLAGLLLKTKLPESTKANE